MTEKHKMNLHPFWTCFEDAIRIMYQGADCYQQFNCAHCGTKQTMEEANHFYSRGICQECDSVTDIIKDGMNYAVVYSFPNQGTGIPTLSVGGVGDKEQLEIANKAREILTRLSDELEAQRHKNAKPS